MSDDELLVPSQYVAAAGIVILLYNHILTFKDEVEHIWQAKSTAPKWLFLILRYVVPCNILWHNYQVAFIDQRHTSTRFCQGWFITAVVLCIVTTAPMHFFSMIRLWVLCGRNKRLVFATLLFFIATECAVLAAAVIIAVEMSPSVKADPGSGTCILTHRDVFWVVFVPGTVFEAISLGILCYNARKLNPFKEDRLSRFIVSQFGIEIFLAMFILNSAKLLGSIFIPLPVLIFYIIFLWSASTVAITSLILNLRRHGSYQKQHLEFESEGLSPCLTNSST